MSTTIVSFPEQTYLGLKISQIIIAISLPKRLTGKYRKQVKRSNVNLVFITVLLKLREVFNNAIKLGKLKMSLEDMERVTAEMAREYCRVIKP